MEVVQLHHDNNDEDNRNQKIYKQFCCSIMLETKRFQPVQRKNKLNVWSYMTMDDLNLWDIDQHYGTKLED